MSNILSHQNIANGTAIPSAETVLATTPVLSMGPSGTKAVIRGNVNLVAGAGTTAVVLKVRQGNAVGGTQIGASYTITLAAAANGSIPFSVEDASGLLQAAGGGQYCITLTQTGGTGNGTVNQGDLEVDSMP